MIGTTLSHYTIEAELGRGGMGIVYKARDTKLDRVVAIKVLPASALSSEDDRARFYREAKAAASLTHANIAAIYQIDEAVPSGGSTEEPRPFIAMEYIDGETLDASVKKGPFKIEDAIRIAAQVAGALGAAHKQEIVHRDIKSANIMLTSEGEAKVLDFGLAQTSASTKLTRMGSTLGTVAYMSPEQARSEEVDHRSDLWSLGVTLYEMISGGNPFGGDYEQAMVYNILNEDPEPLTAVRTGVPMELERITNKLLTKDRDRRYQSATDLIADLRGVDFASVTTSRSSISPSVATVSKKARFSPYLIQAIVFGAILLALGWVIGSLGNSSSQKQVSYSHLQIPAAMLRVASFTSDARFLVFPGSPGTESGSMLYTYDFRTGNLTSRNLLGGIQDVNVSPDDRQIAFVANSMLYVMPFEGGTPVEIRPANLMGSLWIDESKIAFTGPINGSLYLYDFTQGEATELSVPDTSLGIERLYPTSLLPNGKWLVVQDRGDIGSQDLVMFDPKSGQTEMVIEDDGYTGFYVSSGHIVYSPNGNELYVRPFDYESGELYGTPVSAFRSSIEEPYAIPKSGRFAIGKEIKFMSRTLVKLDNSGRLQRLNLPELDYEEFRLNKSGTRILAEINRYQGRRDQAVNMSLDGDGPTFQVSQEGGSFEPVWTENEQMAMFTNDRRGRTNIIMSQSVSGSGEAKVVLDESFGNLGYIDVSSDGKFITYQEDSFGLAGGFLAVYSFDEKRELFRYEDDEELFQLPRFSPDDKFVAYARGVSNKELDIWVTSTDGSFSQRITSDGGSSPVWSADGKKIYYVRENTIYSMGVSTTNGFSVSGSEVQIYTAPSQFYYDVYHDGSGFLLALSGDEGEGGLVTIIDNIEQVLEDLAPTR